MKRQLSLLTLITAIALLASSIGGAIGTSAGFQAGAKQQTAGLSASPLVPVGSGLGYQGQLVQGGVPANGQYDFTFTLYDALAGGNLISGPINLLNQQVTNGLFNVSLDFGPDAFLGDARWLELAVRTAGGGPFTTLTPRQPLSAVPYAQSAPWRGVTSKPWTFNVKRTANTISSLDTVGSAGQFASMTVGVDELGLISYYDYTNGNLKVAHCNNPDCTSATVTTLDSTGDVGSFTDITVGVDGLGLISYYDSTNQDLKAAHCNDVACTSASTATLVSAGGVGKNNSIAIGADGLGLISYLDVTNQEVRVAHCNNASCSSATPGASAYTGPGAGNTSITIGGDGLGLVSFGFGGSLDLKALHCIDVACSISTSPTVDGSGNDGEYNAITTGADGLGLIIYSGTSGALKAAHCNNAACTSATVSILESAATTYAFFPSVSIGANGLGLISYMNYDSYPAGRLETSLCSNVSCTSVGTRIIGNTGDIDFNTFGNYTANTIGADGLGLISYFDNVNGDLKVLRCGNPLCVPYQNGR